jgi:hypothetical protein
MRQDNEVTTQEHSGDDRSLLHRVLGRDEPEHARDAADDRDVPEDRAADYTEPGDRAADYTEPEDRAADYIEPEARTADAEDRSAAAPAIGTASVPVHEPPAAEAAPEPAAAPEAPQGTELKPGDVPTTLVAAIWTEESAGGFRDRWREAQLRFVDDPRQVAEDARDLVNEAVDALTTALASHREQLNSWQASDTEQYRVVVQRYRVFFDRLLTL